MKGFLEPHPCLPQRFLFYGGLWLFQDLQADLATAAEAHRTRDFQLALTMAISAKAPQQPRAVPEQLVLCHSATLDSWPCSSEQNVQT